MTEPRDPAIDPATLSSHLDDLASQRRTIANERRRQRLKSDPEYADRLRTRERARKKREYGKLGTAERLERSARLRAKRQGVKFDLSVQYLRQLWPKDGRCPVLGFRLVLDRDPDEAPSLDRFDPEGGYVMGNVRIISARANRLKNDGHAFEFDRIASYLRAENPLTYTYEGEDR